MNIIEFGTILQISKGKKPVKQSAEPQSGFLPYVDIQAFEKGKIASYANGENCLPCEDGDILIVCDGSRSGLVGFALKGYVGSTLAIISADGMSKKYLYYFLQSLYPLLNTRKKGTGTPHLDQNVLKNAKVYLPPIEEQARIVAQIEELFSQLESGVETLKQTKEQLAVYRQAVLKEAFDRISDSKEQHIEDICETIVDCPHSTPKWTKSGKLCLRTTNFKRGFLDLSVPNFVSDETFNKRNKRLIPLPGDVLYSREGAILGIACIIPKDTFVCLGQRMMLLRANSNTNNRFLMYFLNSPRLTNYVASVTGGSASPHVNVGDIKKFLIPYPALKIQNDIVNYIDEKLSVCDQIEQTVDTTLQQAEALRQSILKKAFEGGL